MGGTTPPSTTPELPLEEAGTTNQEDSSPAPPGAGSEDKSLETVREYINKGNADVVRHEHAQAITDFTYAIVLEPDYGPSYFSRAYVYGLDGEYAKALVDLDKAILLNPQWPAAYESRGKVYAAKKDFQKAIADYDHALSLRNTARIYVERGRVYLGIKDYDKAIDDFGRAIHLNPSWASPYGNRGVAYYMKGDFDDALTDLNDAIHYAPEWAWAYDTRGKIFVAKDDINEAAADFTQASRLNPRSNAPSLTSGLFSTWRRSQAAGSSNANSATSGGLDKTGTVQSELTPAQRAWDRQNATTLWTERIALDPTNSSLYQSRGLLYRQSGDFILATADFSEAIRLGATNSELFLQRGSAYGSEKDYERALADFTDAIRLDPVDGRAYYLRGAAYDRKNNEDAAIADYTKAIQLDPKYANAYCYRAYAYKRKRLYAQAAADYNTAIQLNSVFEDAYNKLAWLLAVCPDASVRNGRKAVGYATEACELTHWKNPEYLDTLAAAYAETGDFDNAVKWQTKCLELNANPAPEVQEKIQQCLALYNEKKAYHEE